MPNGLLIRDINKLFGDSFVRHARFFFTNLCIPKTCSIFFTNLCVPKLREILPVKEDFITCAVKDDRWRVVLELPF